MVPGDDQGRPIIVVFVVSTKSVNDNLEVLFDGSHIFQAPCQTGKNINARRVLAKKAMMDYNAGL
jgi:hypothetical protein